MKRQMALETLLVRSGVNSDKQTTGALVSPIYLSTTYQHPEFGKSTGYDYTRTKNPTRSQLEETLAKIDDAHFALATSSGMSAIVLAMEILPKGAKILACRDLYGGAFRWFHQKEEEGRFSFTYVNSQEDMILELANGYDALYIETPTNPLMIEFDIALISKLAHQQGIKVIVDNTFYTPIYQQPIREGADIVVYSATKYLSGHNDVLAGAVVTDKEDIYQQLFYNLNTTGATLSPFDSYLLMRGLKTLAIRMERSTQNAQAIVEFLSHSDHVEKVYYTGKGGMISFCVADEKRIPSIINKLKLITFAESLGGVESLITYPATQTHADIPQKTRESYGLTNNLLRLSIGIEGISDLIEDLKQALS